MTRKAVVGWLVAAAFGAVPADAQPEPLLQGRSWRDLVLLELIPAWRAHVVSRRFSSRGLRGW